MNNEQLKKLIGVGESTQIEYKECGKRVPDSFYETVVSFSNTDGGSILLGVNDDQNIIGVDKGKADKLKSDVITALNSPDCINPPVFVDPTIHEMGEGIVISIFIPSSSQVHKHSEKIYLRDHESDIDITNNQKRLSDLYQRKWLQLPEDSQSHLAEGLQNVPLPAAMVEASWKELILHLVPSWNEFGIKLKRLDWANNEVSGKDEIQKVPGWDQDGTKLLRKKTVYLIQILVLTSKAISLDDMMSAIGYKKRASFRTNYLDVLENVEFVTKTIPEAKTSPDQKYRLKEKGKLFLAGYNFETKA